MDDTIISGTSLTILERLDNLMGEESTILVDLNDKKEKRLLFLVFKFCWF